MAVKGVKALHPQAAKLLYREHEFLRQFDSPHFPKLRELSPGERKATGQPYVVAMEWLKGRTLKVLHDKSAVPDQVPGELRTILEELKTAGVCHRDIRGANLIWAKTRLVLIDFGWATWKHETDCFIPSGLREPNDDKAAAKLQRLFADKEV